MNILELTRRADGSIFLTQNAAPRKPSMPSHAPAGLAKDFGATRGISTRLGLNVERMPARGKRALKRDPADGLAMVEAVVRIFGAEAAPWFGPPH
jgi:hypothetical protein